MVSLVPVAWQRAPVAARHYRSFESVGDLADYLRAGSDAGPLLSAHRGGPCPGYPENALETFDHTLEVAPALIECDVRMTKDGVAVLMHDGTLERTTTGQGVLREKTLAELRRLRLRDPGGDATPFQIPTLREALAWAEGRAVLTLDIKRKVAPSVVVDAIRSSSAQNRALVIVYDARRYARFMALAPELIYSISVRSGEALRAYEEAEARLDRIVAFVGVGRFDGELVAELVTRGVRPILGTFGDLDRRARREPRLFRELFDQGIGILATDDVVTASRAVDELAGVGKGRGRGGV